ncbi:FtsK/SpoIIIE domain-containing protein [Kineococcus arenarius]|uniref:FtsK/SpoIIIE domain-containing protein n=1 Tax=Kineococcus sp. SYSU DK007 TaxID=3383128 RepID=UPI003D7CC33B
MTLPLLFWPVQGVAVALVLALICCAAFIVLHDVRAGRFTPAARQTFTPSTADFPTQVIAKWAPVLTSAGLVHPDVPHDEWWQGIHPWTDKLARLRDSLFEVIDLYPPVLRGLMTVPVGYQLCVRMLDGQRVSDYQHAAATLAGIWRVPHVRVADGEPGHVLLTLVIRDTLAEPTPRPEPLGLPVPVDLRAVLVGVTEDGAPWTLPLLNQAGTVIGGVPGSGKSSLIATLLDQLDGHPHARLVGIDLKGGVDLGPWHRCGTLTDLATTPAEAVELLQQLAELHQDRQRLLRAHGADKISDLGLTPDLPLVVVLIDEAADLFTALSPNREDKALAVEATALVSTLVRQGRATGIATVLATQKPTTDAIPSQVRDSATSKVALRCSTAEQVKAILADLAALAPVSPTAIPAATPGVALATTATGGVVRARVYNTSTSSGRSSSLSREGQS